MIEVSEQLDDRLKWIKDTLASVTEGQALLDLAEAVNAKIVFSEELVQKEEDTFVTRGEMLWGGENGITINLNPSCKNKELVQTLAHELRHLWQHAEIDFKNRKKLKPLDRLAFMRLIEGDANAFAAFVVKKIRKKIKLNLTCTLHGIISETDRLKLPDPAFMIPFVFENYQNKMTQKEQSNYESKIFDELEKRQQKNKLDLPNLSMSEAFNNIANVLNFGNPAAGKTYLDAKNADDYVEKIANMMKPEIKNRALAMTAGGPK